jgi:hypothetical protein
LSTEKGHFVNIKIRTSSSAGERTTDRRIAQIITYIQERPRWVTSKELQDELKVPSDLVYYVLHTLYMLDKVELGTLAAGRGRPKMAAQWIGRRTSTLAIRTYVVEGSGSQSKGVGPLSRRVSELEASNGASEIEASNGGSS